ncbi:MAG: hypothetical protein ACLQDL_00955 [Spirochaetia bacterium]
MPTRRSILALLAGLLLFDILVNLPGFSPASPFRSLLLPSIDLLVIAAACMGISQAGERARLPLRIAVSALAALLVAWSTGLRFGFDIEARLFGGGSLLPLAAGWTASLALIAASGAAAFLLSGLLVGGLQPQISRSVFLFLVSLVAVLQVVSGRRLFSPSVIPRIIGLAGK